MLNIEPLSGRFPCTVWACPSLRESLDDESISTIEKIATVLLRCLLLYPIFFLVADAVCNIGFEVKRICDCSSSVAAEEEEDLIHLPDLMSDDNDPLYEETIEEAPQPNPAIGNEINHSDLTKEEKFIRFRDALAEEDPFTIAMAIAQSNLTAEQKIKLFEIALEKDPTYIIEYFASQGFSKEQKLNFFKLALREDVYKAIGAIDAFHFTEMERFELAEFLQAQVMQLEMAFIEKFTLNQEHQDALINNQSSLEPHFQKIILKHNEELFDCTRNCLILQAEDSIPNHTAIKDGIEEIGRTHRIALKVIDYANIQEEIARAKQEMDNRPIDVLILRDCASSHLESVSASDFENIHPEGTILLFTPFTDTIGPVAQKISRVFQGAVYAPTKSTPDDSVLTIENRVVGLHFDVETGKIVTCRYQHGVGSTFKYSDLSLSSLKSKNMPSRMPEEHFVLGQAYRYKKLVAIQRNLSEIAAESHQKALRHFDLARFDGHIKSMVLYYDMKLTKA